ncbi:MAG: hypothetical protein QXH37_01410 [Candidatus Bathyarchaeia archaeon]
MEKEPLRYKRKSNRENSMHKFKADSTPTMNQLKLAIATELKSEGYNIVMFDKPIEACGRRIIAHVYCEDNLGLRIAVARAALTDRIRLDPMKFLISLSSLKTVLRIVMLRLLFRWPCFQRLVY